jgi:hypothetical protein
MRQLLILYLLVVITGCGVAKSSFSPYKKYSPEVLQKDYAIYRQTLEEAHPGLYWYTSKDSMNYYFDKGFQQLNDSLTEPEFRKILSYVTAKINCGHTSIRPSKTFAKYQDTVRLGRVFPLSLKLWQDTAVVAANLNRRDSILKRGTIITAINGLPMDKIVDTLFSYIGTDGYNRTNKYQVLSNRGYFGSLYSTLFGYPPAYSINFIDSMGRAGTTLLRPFFPGSDTMARARAVPVRRLPQPSRKERKQMRRNSVRLLKLDTTSHVAMMDLNSFGRGYGLKSFFRRSFRAIKKNKIEHLIIDVRGNGGGSVTNSTLITRFLSDHPFKVADSLYAIRKRKTYSRYIQNDFFNRLFLTLFAPKRKDGKYHFKYYERHLFKPRKKNHFDGKTYILTGGNSFSATTLFASAIMKQDNVTLIGEETGGGAYGNSAWLIPDMTLPGTKVRFRLPLFRLVIDKNVPKDGRGVQPEIPSFPTVDAVRKGIDYKLVKTMELIKQDKDSNQ